MATGVRVLHHSYTDSVELLAITRTMRETDGVGFASAVMATPANLEGLGAEGFDEIPAESANDLVLAVRADADASVEEALSAGLALRSDDRPGHPADGVRAERPPRVLGEALEAYRDTNVAIVSVPGPYAALEAHKALSAGLHVLLFSDNVSLEDEIALKEHAARANRLVMGPGAGTAKLGGCGLGFANETSAGRIGVVAAAGTGAQEVMALLERWGEGVSHVIGLGGRDLTGPIGGRGAQLAVRALDDDPATELIVLVSKPPSPDAARKVIAARSRTPMVCALIGLEPGTAMPGAAAVSSSLEGGVVQAIRLLGGDPPRWSAWRDEVAASLDGLDTDRTTVQGLFSGGTLCYEALTLLAPWLGPVWSNTPLDQRQHVPAPEGVHVCLDLGEEEYTSGRPHPMIDPESRVEHLAGLGRRGDVAVVVLDVVLGFGAHDDPGSVLAPACAALAAAGAGPRVIAYVLGTVRDPQGLDRQRQAFREAGCLVAPTGARAALGAAAIALRQPDIARADVP